MAINLTVGFQEYFYYERYPPNGIIIPYEDISFRNSVHKRQFRERLLLTFLQYLQHKKVFDRIYVYINSRGLELFRNGTLAGLLGKMNGREVDILVDYR